MVKKILFIEGTKNDTNGNLRQGFHKLLVQRLKGYMPRIKMGNGITTTIKAFKKNTMSEFGFLLIDLDAPKPEKSNKLLEYQLESQKDSVFFMIQEMEAWFFSQPDILDAFYGGEISQKIPKKNSEDIAEPARHLMDLTRNTKKGEYHKVKHSVKLLEKLDAHELERSSSEFAALIKRLKET